MKLKGRYILITICILAIVIFLGNYSFGQCSMCRKIATDGANTKTAGASLNTGILYLLAMPYLLITFFFRKQIFGFMRGLLKK